MIIAGNVSSTVCRPPSTSRVTCTFPPSTFTSDAKVGTVLGLFNDGLAIKVLDGVVLIHELQVEGKNRMTAQAFYQGMGKQWVNHSFDTYES